MRTEGHTKRSNLNMKQKADLFDPPWDRSKAIVVLICGLFIIGLLGVTLLIGLYNNRSAVINVIHHPSDVEPFTIGAILMMTVGTSWGIKMVVYAVSALINPDKLNDKLATRIKQKTPKN